MFDFHTLIKYDLPATLLTPKLDILSTTYNQITA